MAERTDSRQSAGQYGQNGRADTGRNRYSGYQNPQGNGQYNSGYQRPQGSSQYNNPQYNGPYGGNPQRPPRQPNAYSQNANRQNPYPPNSYGPMNANAGGPGYPGGGSGNGGNGKKGGRKKKKSTFGDVFSGLLMIIALCVFLYSGYTLYGYYKEYKKSADEYDNLEDNFIIQNAEETEAFDKLEGLEEAGDEETSEPMTEEMVTVEENGQTITVPTMSNPVDFTELKNLNEDIIGWLKIRALDISYPIVQGEDNDFYLHRTFEKQDSFAGCIFMNCDNEADLTDMNTIIYGHNMKDGSMFGKLKKFEDEDVWKKSEYFWIFTPELIYQYHIFSVRVVNKTGPTYQTFFTDEEFQNLINTAFSQSMVDNSDMTVTTDDRIVTLSTCTSNDATRLVVMGKLEQVYAAKQ